VCADESVGERERPERAAITYISWRVYDNR
jgi:hypothetical protein